MYLTVENRLSSLEVVRDGEFGDISAPVFVDEVDCTGAEENIVDCDFGTRIGFINDFCACDDCAEDLGLRCPGLY